MNNIDFFLLLFSFFALLPDNIMVCLKVVSEIDEE